MKRSLRSGGQLDEVGFDLSLREEVDDGQKKERLMRCLLFGRSGPDSARGAGEVGE